VDFAGGRRFRIVTERTMLPYRGFRNAHCWNRQWCGVSAGACHFISGDGYRTVGAMAGTAIFPPLLLASFVTLGVVWPGFCLLSAVACLLVDEREFSAA
jgi:hypothetical protein